MDESPRERDVRRVEGHRVEVRVAEQQMAAGAQHACDFFQEGLLVRQALEHVVADRRREASVSERQRPVQVGCYEPHVRVQGDALEQFGHLPLDTDELDRRAKALEQRSHRRPGSTAEIDHGPCVADGKDRCEVAMRFGAGLHRGAP